MAAGLEIEGLSVLRGRSRVVADVSLLAAPAAITLLLGPNGAGKTTLLEAISGVIDAASGTIAFDGVQLKRASRVRRARIGIAHVEQGRTVFRGLSVDENLRVASRGASTRAAYAWFPELSGRAHIAAEMLSGGEQQMLVIARALLSHPRLLLVDELSLGLAPAIIRRLYPVLRRVADEGTAVIAVEQFAHFALPLADVAYVMNAGRLTTADTAEHLAADGTRLREAYFGTPSNSGQFTSSKKTDVDNS